MASQTTFAGDIAALTAAVTTNSQEIAQVVTLVQADAASIASLTAQIAALQASNPAIDLSGLEADIAQLGTNNQTAQTILAPTVAPTPVVPTGSSATPNAKPTK